MTSKKIGIIGVGNVGKALARGLKRAGHEVRTATKDVAQLRDVVSSADVVFLAVPFGAVDDVVGKAGDLLAGKPLVDVTNALDAQFQLVLGFSTSGAEELQKKVPAAKVVKAFNTVFAEHLDDGHVGDRRLSVFAAGDDAAAKAGVLDLARDIGFDAVDAGPLRNARLLEPFAYLNIQLGYMQQMGTGIGFELVRA